MNIPSHSFRKLAAVAGASLLLAACSSAPTKPEGADYARIRLTQLQSNPDLSAQAPMAIQEAELAVSAAEVPQKDKVLARQLVQIADSKVDSAWTQAQGRLQENQRQALSSARLDTRASNLETDAARSDANTARMDANLARNQADAARMDTEAARLETADLQRQIALLNARATERGLVVTLGDVLFDSGMSGLKSTATENLSNLSNFLKRYQDRTVIIEGHTDNVGSNADNLSLSEYRANSVKSYLVSHGVGPTRLSASGKGESSPIADNNSAAGRQQNRRVEVIISNTVSASR